MGIMGFSGGGEGETGGGQGSGGGRTGERRREKEGGGEEDAGVRVRRGWHTKARVSPSNRAH